MFSLIRIFANGLDKVLRQVICDYYARRVDDEVDKLWDEGKWDNEKNEAILKEHLRTPYHPAK